MNLTRSPIVVLVCLAAVVLAAGGITVGLLARDGGSESSSADDQAGRGSSDDIENRANEYAMSSAAGDFDGTYEMLSAEAKSKISPEDWRLRNETSISSFGHLDSAQLVESQQLSATEAVATIEFRYATAGTIPAIIRLTLEEGSWMVVVSIAPSTP